jgi:hypothetical protein
MAPQGSGGVVKARQLVSRSSSSCVFSVVLGCRDTEESRGEWHNVGGTTKQLALPHALDLLLWDGTTRKEKDPSAASI